jgi:hypothetical protein
MRTKTVGLLTLALIVAAPALVLADSGSTRTFDPNSVVTWWSDENVKATKGDFKPVPGLPFDQSCGGCQPAIALAVSADMRKGSALVRVVNGLGQVAEPGPVLFSSKASNAFHFVIEVSGESDDFTVEWKRKGKAKTKTSAFSAELIGTD